MDAADQGEDAIDAEGGPLSEAGSDDTIPAGEAVVAPPLAAAGPSGAGLHVEPDAAIFSAIHNCRRTI